MNRMTIVGAVLIVLALIGLTAGGLTYKDKDTTDLGPIDITVTEKKRVNIPPALAITALIGGIALVVAGTRRRGA